VELEGVDRQERELLPPPQPAIEVANASSIKITVCHTFMTGGLPESQNREELDVGTGRNALAREILRCAQDDTTQEEDKKRSGDVACLQLE
jgi:hypothetical protein